MALCPHAFDNDRRGSCSRWSSLSLTCIQASQYNLYRPQYASSSSSACVLFFFLPFKNAALALYLYKNILRFSSIQVERSFFFFFFWGGNIEKPKPEPINKHIHTKYIEGLTPHASFSLFFFFFQCSQRYDDDDPPHQNVVLYLLFISRGGNCARPSYIYENMQTKLFVILYHFCATFYIYIYI